MRELTDEQSVSAPPTPGHHVVYLDRVTGPPGVIHLRTGIAGPAVRDPDGTNWVPVSDGDTPGEAILVACSSIISDTP